MILDLQGFPRNKKKKKKKKNKMATGGFELVDNNLIKEADDYIKNNRLVELFEDLPSLTLFLL